MRLLAFVYYLLRRPGVNRVEPMPDERLRAITADITTLDVERVGFVCFEPRVGAAFERAPASHADGESA